MTRSVHPMRALPPRAPCCHDGRFVRRGPISSPGLLAGLLLVFLVLVPHSGRAQLPPDAEWRTIRTEHFRITFHAGLEELAGRAAERAERAWRSLSESFVSPPPGRIDVVLTDQADISNGFARTVPSNRITIYARPPVDEFGLAWFDDWLELVITHEVAHVFHLDRAGTLGVAVRALFGRLPGAWPVFPGRSVPTWTIEGIATFYESALSDAGRAHGTYHEMILRTSILDGTFERIDQASGSSPVWPGGSRAYIYGSLFFEHLLERYGEERMARFVDAVAGQWIPYRLNSAARSAFGVSFSRAWREWEAELEQRFAAEVEGLAALAPLTRPERLTRDARVALHPSVSPSGDGVAFVRRDATSDPQIRVMATDGSDGRSLARTNGAASFSWAPDGSVVLAQVEWDDPWRLWSDLYRITPDGRSERLTSGARLVGPSVHPDGRTALAVQEGGGTNRLVEVDLETGAVTPLGDFLPGEHWSGPSWSPDGRRFAASRWRPGARRELVVMDRDGTSHAVTADRALDVHPAWSPDGRRILWSSDRTGIPNLFAVDVDPESGRPGTIRQITNVTGGAFHPAVDPDGRWIYFSSYRARGWEIERIPYDPGAWFAPFDTDFRFLEGGERAAATYATRVDAVSTPYRPYRSLLPRAWEPIFREGSALFGTDVVPHRFGAEIEGEDLVGRHAYSAWGAWAPGSGLWEGRTRYAYAGLGHPVLSMGVDQTYRSGGAMLAPNEQDTLFLRVRERSVSGSASFVRQRARSAAGLSVSARHIWQDIGLLDSGAEPAPYALERPQRKVGEGAVTVTFGNARLRPLSISAEDGVSLSVRGRVQRELGVPAELAGVRGGDRSFDEVTGTARLFRSWPGPGFANHVIGVRGSAGAGRGP
ncbi:MAG: hypothetical protein WDZ89_05030, partial [Gemmatimonadota bacterium]